MDSPTAVRREGLPATWLPGARAVHLSDLVVDLPRSTGVVFIQPLATPADFKKGPNMAVDDIYECRLEGVCSSAERWNMVCHYRKTNETTEDEYESAEALASEIGYRYEQVFVPNLANDHYYTSARAVKIYPSLGIPATAPSATAPAGDQPYPSLPGDVALVCTKRTKTPGKSGRGRMYLSGISDNDHTFDILNDIAAGTLATSFHYLLLEPIADSAANEWVGVVFSRKNATTVPPTEPVWSDIWRVEINRTLKNMRSRGRDERRPVVGQPYSP